MPFSNYLATETNWKPTMKTVFSTLLKVVTETTIKRKHHQLKMSKYQNQKQAWK